MKQAAEYLKATMGYLPKYGDEECTTGDVDHAIEAVLADAKAELDAAAARLSTVEAANAELAAKLEDERARHKVEVLDILRDMRLPRLEVRGTAGGRHQILGRNAERQAINFYCRQKAYEYDPQGIGPDPTESGQWDTRPDPAAPPLEEAVPAAGPDLATATHIHATVPRPPFDPGREAFYPGTASAAAALPTTGEGKEGCNDG